MHCRQTRSHAGPACAASPPKGPTQRDNYRRSSSCIFLPPALPHTSAKRWAGLFCFAFCYFTTPSPCTPSLALTGVCSEAPGFAAAVLSGAVGILLKPIANGCMDRKHQPPSCYSNQRVKTRGGCLEPFGCLLGVQHDLLSGAHVNKHVQSGALTLSNTLDKVVC